MPFDMVLIALRSNSELKVEEDNLLPGFQYWLFSHSFGWTQAAFQVRLSLFRYLRLDISLRKAVNIYQVVC